MVSVPEDPGFLTCDAIQAILADYVLEDGQFIVSRDEAEAIYRKIIEAARKHG